MTTICWDVDTQNDFILADGALSVPGALELIPRLRALTDWAHAQGHTIVATTDDHLPEHAEISDQPDYQTTFPPHCMAGTPGQEKIVETTLNHPLLVDYQPRDEAELRAAVQAHQGDFCLTKSGTDVFEWNPNADTVIHVLQPHRIVIYGVATDFCVRLAVTGLRNRAPHAELVIVTDAMAAINAGDGAALIQSWRESGYSLKRTDEITAA